MQVIIIRHGIRNAITGMNKMQWQFEGARDHMQLDTSEKVSFLEVWHLKWALENGYDLISRDAQKACLSIRSRSKNPGWKYTGNVCLQCRVSVGSVWR